MEISFAEQAEVLVQALPYIQQYGGKIVVIKYGGNAMINQSLKKAVMTDIVLLSKTGVKVVLVQSDGILVIELQNLERESSRREMVL